MLPEDPVFDLVDEVDKLKKQLEMFQQDYPNRSDIEPNSIGSGFSISGVWGKVKSFFGYDKSTSGNLTPTKRRNSTEIGSTKLSPSQDKYDRKYTEPRTRRQAIKKIRQVLARNPLINAAWKKYTEGALGPGVSVIVEGNGQGVLTPMIVAKANRIIQRLMNDCQIPMKLAGWGKWCVADGDLFLQLKAVLAEDNESYRITAIKKMPSATMERLTDDLDEFFDTSKAYLQRDLATDKIIAYFAEWQVLQVSFDKEDGERYGTSLILPMIQMGDAALDASLSLSARRRATKPIISHRLVDDKGVPYSPTQRKNYIDAVSMKKRIIRGEYSEYDEIFGAADVKAVLTDGRLGEIKDIEFLYDLALAPTGISRQLLGSSATVTRDILDEVRSEAYAVMRQLSDLFADQLLKPLFNIALMMAGIDPDLITYKITFKQRYTESAMERRIDRMLRSKAAGMINVELGMPVQADYFDIADIKRAIKSVEDEEKQKVDQQRQYQQNQQLMSSMFAQGQPFQPGQQDPNNPNAQQNPQDAKGNSSDPKNNTQMGGFAVKPVGRSEYSAGGQGTNNNNFLGYGANPDAYKNPTSDINDNFNEDNSEDLDEEDDDDITI